MNLPENHLFCLRSALKAWGALTASLMLMLVGAHAGETPGAGFDRNHRPLPLAANWNCNGPKGYGPVWQYEQIENGHHLLFTFRFSREPLNDAWKKKYEPIFTGLRERKAPVCLRWGNWVNDVKDRSPFSPVENWRRTGEQIMGEHEAKLKQLQQWYPNPPYVVMLSNNEARVPSLKQLIKKGKYTDKLGTTPLQQQKAYGEAYLERYKAMFDGMRAVSGDWGKTMRFIGYAWGGEANIGMYSRLASPLAWDGVSARNYIDRGLTDYKTYSATVTAMNLRLKKAWYLSQKKDVHFEISPWWRKKKGVPPERYGALVIWNLWVARPHSARQFTGWGQKRDSDWSWYQQVVKAVDMVHNNETLRTFWKEGEPVVNPEIEIGVHVIDAHPAEGTWSQGRLKGFVTDAQMKTLEAMSHAYYGLKTSVDPKQFAPKREKHGGRVEFDKKAEFRVWAQAQVMGAKPNRQWLVFAYAPRGDETGIKITIPNFKAVTLDVPQKGVFAVVNESAGMKTIEVPK